MSKWSAWIGGCVVAIVVSASPLTDGAELKLANVFSDHMVLQRDKPVAVWGWGEPGTSVIVRFAGQEQLAQVAADGKWSTKLAPLTASTEGRTLEVSPAEGGKSLRVQDILVGEVWLGSGQSNMAMSVSRAQDFSEEQARARLPQVRMFKEDSAAALMAMPDSRGQWTVCSPDTVGTFSATLYFFGRELHRELQVPIGLINSSVGGTPIESWIAAEAQARVPALKADADKEMRDAPSEEAAREQYERSLERWRQQAAKAKASGQAAPRRPQDPAVQKQRRGGPGGLFNGKIAPLIPYTIRGVLWYQGEANSRPGKGSLYQHQLALLVSDWRERWGEELPFAWVQLPNFARDGEDWLLVRESMLKTLRLPRTGMAITIDIGDPKDIHPKNKQEVGRRLAMWAFGAVYGRSEIATSGPLPSSHRIREGAVEVTFRHADGGLQAKGERLTGFEVAGEDGMWVSAEARIDGDTVIVSTPKIPHPVAARYAWATNPVCNLYNGQGLPASPFRTE